MHLARNMQLASRVARSARASQRRAVAVAAAGPSASSAAASFTTLQRATPAATPAPNADSTQSRPWRLIVGIAMAVGATVGVSTRTSSTLAEAQPTSPIKRPTPTLSTNDQGINLNKILAPSVDLHISCMLSTDKPLLVLVACGSYSPITNMHLLVFEQARNYLQFEQNRYDVVGGFLSPVHDAYGKASLIPQAQRAAMCHAAVRDNEWLSVQEWEMNQTGWSTTADTLCKYQEAINRAHLAEDPIRVKMLCGADLLESTLVPGLWAKKDLDLIFGTIGVVVIERVGLDLAKLISDNEQLRRYASNIDIVPQRIANTISSTSVRTLVRTQQSIKYLTPDAVIDYIYENKLYGHDPAKHPTKTDYLKPKVL